MAETQARDVNNHVLFEIATEVANRGTSAAHGPAQSTMLTSHSGRYLLGAQVKSSGDDSRVWLSIHITGTAQQGLGELNMIYCGVTTDSD